MENLRPSALHLVPPTAHIPMEDMHHSTGYPISFVELVQQVIDERDKSKHAALIFISLNNMPMILSGYGHQESEAAVASLTQSVAEHLDLIDPRRSMTRIQKDQLAVLLEDYEVDVFAGLAQGLARHIKGFGYESSYGMIHILASVACVALPNHTGALADEVLNQAYIAVKNSQGVQTSDFKSDIAEISSSRQEMNMVNYITRSIHDGQFCMAFQPIISSSTGEIAHYEALLRVLKKDGDMATAGPLIPVAERMGLIDIIDELVLDMVVEEMLENPKINLSFNVSNLTANSPSWLNKFNRVAKDHPEIIPRMMVEITETAVHLDLRRTAYFVASIQALGAKVALDDFGSGYTSFRQLKSLSVDVIKIDGVFIRDLVDNHDNHLFIQTMLNFTNGFGLETVAEFVENGETAKILMDLGVHYMQGYYFGFPEPKRIFKNL